MSTLLIKRIIEGDDDDSNISINNNNSGTGKNKIWLVIDDMYQSSQNLIDYFIGNIKKEKKPFVFYDANLPFLQHRDVFADIKSILTNSSSSGLLIIISAQRDILDRVSMNKLLYLASITFNIYSLNNTNSMPYKINVLQKLNNIYEVFRQETFTFDGNESFEVFRSNSENKEQSNTDNDSRKMPVSTFNLSVSKEQRKIKESTELPFMRQQQHGKILAEDYDEESPVDD